MLVESNLEQLGFRLQKTNSRYAGLIFSNTTGPNIYNVLDNSPTSSSGIAPDDVLIRVEGFPFTMKALSWAIAHLDKVRLEVDPIRSEQKGTTCGRTSLRS